MDRRAQASLAYTVATDVLAFTLVTAALAVATLPDLTSSLFLKTLVVFTIVFAYLASVWWRLGSMSANGIFLGQRRLRVERFARPQFRVVAGISPAGIGRNHSADGSGKRPRHQPGVDRGFTRHYDSPGSCLSNQKQMAAYSSFAAGGRCFVFALSSDSF